MPPFRALSGPARLYAVTVITIGVALLPLSWFLFAPLSAGAIPTLLYLAVGTQIAALRPIPWKTGHQSVVDPLLVASGLYSPGFGVGLVAWLATFDGRVPGRSIPWWAFLFNRAAYAITHVLPSIAVASIAAGAWWSIPARTILYVVAAVAMNYIITALAIALATRTSFWTTLLDNVGFAETIPTIALNFAGGILYLLLFAQPYPVGYVIAPGLFGFVLAVRSTIADVQRQTILKDQTLDLAAQALDARDRYTESHSIRVSELAGALAEHLELGDRECELIRTAGALHDLGKIGVRDDILNKPGPLSEEEWEIMRRHPDIGADMIAQHSALAEVAPIVRHHHERWDGTGYPAGLKGDVIPFGARILTVADSFDTITGARLYRPSLMTPIEAVEDISRRASHWYDANVVDALREIHGLRPLEVINRPEVPRRITTLRVIRANPGFSSLVTAIAISSLGDPLTQVATLVAIYLATSDPRLVALAFVAQAIATVGMSTALGGIADRFRRRQLVVTLELVRAAILVVTPFIVGGQVLARVSHATHWWLLIPILFFLAAINAVVQPARQAAIPNLVPAGQVGKANAIIAATTMLSGAVGFGLAGGFLAIFQSPYLLFIADAATFVLAAVIVAGIPNLGGGVSKTSLAGAPLRSWSIVAARPHLVVAGIASFLLAMSFPALLALAYEISPRSGGQTYSILELALSVGILAGSVAVSRYAVIGNMRTVGAGLFLTGIFSVAIALGLPAPLVALALVIASFGNPIYAVANQTALVEAADSGNRGSVMSTRFGLVQTASILGTVAGGLITKQFHAEAAYGALGVGLVMLALYALAAGRSTVNPLHGAKYEEAVLQQAKT
ncbi:MAG TPA: MFS transporter [Candidatus Dormibacteraeota bacterium]|nr:MFS transporter [Candidatus Dormibacteraeota bacterium]